MPASLARRSRALLLSPDEIAKGCPAAKADQNRSGKIWTAASRTACQRSSSVSCARHVCFFSRMMLPSPSGNRRGAWADRQLGLAVLGLARAGPLDHLRDPHHNSAHQPRHAPRLKIAHLHLDRPVPLPLVDSRGKRDAAFAVAAQQFFPALGHTPSNCSDGSPVLPDAEAQMALVLPHRFRIADDVEAAGQESRPRIVRPIRLQLVQVAQETGREGTQRHFAEMQAWSRGRDDWPRILKPATERVVIGRANLAPTAIACPPWPTADHPHAERSCSEAGIDRPDPVTTSPSLRANRITAADMAPCGPRQPTTPGCQSAWPDYAAGLQLPRVRSSPRLLNHLC